MQVMARAAPPVLQRKPGGPAGAGRGDRGPRDGDRRRPGGEGDRQGDVARVGLWLALAAITMLFVGFTSTYLVRRAQPDWRVGPLPWLFWVNTAVLLISSAAAEIARRAARRGLVLRARQALSWAAGLSLVFVAGQLAAWRQLMAAGVFMASSPHAAFVYLLSGAHALHVLGGVGALLYALHRLRRAGASATLAAREGVARVADLAATYWHFVDVLWLYLFALLYAL